MTMSTFSWVLLENAKVSSFYSPKAGPIEPDRGPIEKRDTHQTDRHGQTHGRTNITFWGPSTEKALKGKNPIQILVSDTLLDTKFSYIFVDFINFHVFRGP